MKLIARAVLSFALLFPQAALAENGVSDSEIVIGETANLTGPNSNRSRAAHDGAKLYFEQLNARGGVKNRKIRLVTYDDKYDAETAFKNVSTLLDNDKAFAI